MVPDRVVAATYLAAAGMAGGEVTITDARPEHMEMLLRKVDQMGVSTDMGPHGLRVSADERLVAADVYRPAAIDQLETLGQSLGIPVDSWGTMSLNTSKPISEIMV